MCREPMGSSGADPDCDARIIRAVVAFLILILLLILISPRLRESRIAWKIKIKIKIKNLTVRLNSTAVGRR